MDSNMTGSRWCSGQRAFLSRRALRAHLDAVIISSDVCSPLILHTTLQRSNDEGEKGQNGPDDAKNSRYRSGV
jgi:hypothetical protein